MKIVIDERIPYIKEVLEAMGCSVLAKPGVDIRNADLLDAEALFVRTRTVCNAALLAGTAVRFIGTATIGYDHIDADYCASAGIVWTNAAGCNAGAVLQYVQSAIYEWAREEGVSLHGLVMGVVGVGEIGSRVAAWASSVGMHLLLNDPPRAAKGDCGLVELSEIAKKCDIITFHPTLSREGNYPSWHLVGEQFLSSLRRCRLLINASRGAVADNEALQAMLSRSNSPKVVLDVWENEPHISSSLLNKVYIATPHIAGYSAEGKINATRIVLEKFASYFGIAEQLPELKLPSPAVPFVNAASLPEALLKIYNPADDSRVLKQAPGSFEELRNNYDLRREPSAFEIVING